MAIKVSELAEEYQIDAKALLNHLRDLGIFVSSHISLLDDEEVDRVRATISHVQKRQSVTEKRVKPTVIRRRVVKAPEEAPEAAPQIEQAPEAPSEIEPEVAVGTGPDAEAEATVAPVDEESVTAAEAEAEVVTQAEPPKKKKKAKKEEPARIIKKPAVVEMAEAPETEPPAVAAEMEPASVTAPEVSKPEEAPAVEEEISGKGPAKTKREKPARPKEEPAKIIEPTSPEILRRIAGAQLAPPSPTPEISSPLEVGDEVARKPKPKRRKALKAFEVIQQERPARGRRGRKKEVIQLRDELEERERAFRVGARKKKAREPKKTELTTPRAIKRKIRIAESITAGELAKRMGVKASDVIKKLFNLGIMANVNQALDSDEAALVASEFEYEVERVVDRAEEILEEYEAPDAEEDLQPRPPVITVMGHVDHGKTSLLDAIRHTHVTDREAGGITQHIGAYQVTIEGQTITFLDTPGHEAFTSLRARGARVTDIVVLVVAADDGVMNQTLEAIDHTRAAGVPIIVAINKIDKSNAEPERVMQELSGQGLVPEAWGGDTIFCEVSAKQRTGIQALLEYILLQAEMLELKSNPKKMARGTVLEARLDRHRGPVSTILIQEGTLRQGDAFICGAYAGKVRMMFDHLGNRLEEAPPSTPVEVVGASGVPQPGERFVAVADEREARNIEAYRKAQIRKEEMARGGKVSLERLMERMEAEEVKELSVVLKADVQGSIETLRDTLHRLGGEKIKIQEIHASVGGITENDVNLASASKAVIIGFNVRPEARAQALAEELGVEIRLYDVIYELIDDVRMAMIGMLEPTRRENLLGRGEVIQLFKITRVGTVAGTMVKEGRIVMGAQARVVRDGVVVHEGRIDSLKRYQEDSREVLADQDCGIHLEHFNDIKVGDMIEAYELEEVAPEL